jgi:hypothetical protein
MRATLIVHNFKDLTSSSIIKKMRTNGRGWRGGSENQGNKLMRMQFRAAMQAESLEAERLSCFVRPVSVTRIKWTNWSTCVSDLAVRTLLSMASGSLVVAPPVKLLFPSSLSGRTSCQRCSLRLGVGYRASQWGRSPVSAAVTDESIT